MAKKIESKFKYKLILKMPFDSIKRTKTLFEATVPENEESPATIQIKSRQKQNVIFYEIRSNKDVWDIITTVEDLFEKIDLSIKTIEQIEE
jgi:hypothetical protein